MIRYLARRRDDDSLVLVEQPRPKRPQPKRPSPIGPARTWLEARPPERASNRLRGFLGGFVWGVALGGLLAWLVAR